MTAAEIALAPARTPRAAPGLRRALASWWAARTEARLARLAEDRARRLPRHLLTDIGLAEAQTPPVPSALWPGVPPHRAPLPARPAGA